MVMSPAEYTKQYHNLVVNDPRQKLFEVVNITRYQNGGREETNKEYWTLIGQLAKILGRKVEKHTAPFYFPKDDVMNTVEQFYPNSIRRAFWGKASPDEMRDTLRLAYRCGRIGRKAVHRTLSSYAKAFLGLDCNALVGNYHGISPGLNIKFWAEGKADVEKLSLAQRLKLGWDQAEMLSRPFFPLVPRQSAREVRAGDVLVTVISGTIYKHVAMVDEVAPVDDQRVTLRVVEWGDEGGEAHHIKNRETYKLVKGTAKQYGLAIGGGSKYRYLFSAPRTPFFPAEFGRCGREDI